MPDNHSSKDRLDSWKDIAAYLGRDVRTVIRWEEKGLPVRRVPGGKRQLVFAYRAEIDKWLASSPGDGTPVAKSGRTPAFRSYARLFLGSLAIMLLVGAALAFFPRSEGPVQPARFTRLSQDGLYKTGLATDGISLYFSELEDGKLQLSRMPVAGGPISRIATPFPYAAIEDFNGDRGELLLIGSSGSGTGEEHERALWSIPADGRQPRRIGSVHCHSATWSPDGKAIAYSRGNGIFLTFDEGASSRELRGFESEPGELRWLKSGHRIRFVLRNSETLEFTRWEIELGDQFDIRAVSRTPQPARNCCLGWAEAPDYEFFAISSRDGSQILASRRQQHWWQPAHPQGEELSSQLGTITSLAVNSRTGQLFALVEEPTRGEFVRLDPLSRTFSSFLAGVSGEFPDFSPDGQWVVYSALSDGALWLVRADRGENKRLTSPSSLTEIELPRWSPDGTRIAFMARKPTRPYRIYVVPVAGGVPQEASAGADNQGAPTWSPDGKWIAYGNVECQETMSCAIHRIQLSTGKVDTLPGSDGLQTARWSPDGRSIAALRPDRHELWLFDVKKQHWAKLTDSIMGDDLGWSRDSQYLYSARPAGDSPEILRVPIKGGKAEPVAGLVSLSRLNGRFHVGFGIASDDSIVLFRELNSSEIYAVDWNRR